MKLRLNPSVTEPAIATSSNASRGISSATQVGKPAEPEGADGILISNVSAAAANALNELSVAQTAKVERVAAAVQGGSYQDDSVATSNAIVEHALAGGAHSGEN